MEFFREAAVKEPLAAILSNVGMKALRLSSRQYAGVRIVLYVLLRAGTSQLRIPEWVQRQHPSLPGNRPHGGEGWWRVYALLSDAAIADSKEEIADSIT